MFKNEKIVETKICIQCQSEFEITDKDLEFYEKVSPSFGGQKYSIPTPTLCPDCRLQRRSVFRNVRKLYKRTCDATGKPIISIYSPDKPYKVYNQEFWWSDKWDALKYGIDFDFTRSFFHQIGYLIKSVPKISLSTEKLENSDYVNYSGRIKNCYLVFISAYDENCYYSNGLRYSENTMDSTFSQYLNNCYNIIDSLNCTGCFYLSNSKNCNNCYYGENLEGCSNCLYCMNLKNKQYCVLNKEIGKEEYDKIKDSFLNNKEYIKKYKELLIKSPHKNTFNILSENCEGEYIVNSKNIYQGFDLSNVHDCKYVDWLLDSKNCYDVYDWGETAEQCYECYKIGKGVYNTLFSAFCIENISNLIYCYDCVNNCSNCFGCVGLKNKSYCILNKQYTKDEYEELVPKIIEHMMKTREWGEFFPSSMSPFGYNETVANEYFPLSRENGININVISSEVERSVGELNKNLGKNNVILKEQIPPLQSEGQSTFLHGPVFNRSTYEQEFPKVDKIIPASKLPEDIKHIPDDILNWAIECEITKKPFRIISQELEFYRKHKLPIPKRHPDQRHLDRMSLRNPRKLFDRTCDKCGKDIKTTYSPERPEIVYCEYCYNNEIY
ncbi:MAG: hypothetical protein PHN31_02230 [Candidatus Gracilibacteria bacterium]|nr:hypothetical protein [Candidatus Gracilibacteria bacterium]